jgi:antitoxin CptB
MGHYQGPLVLYPFLGEAGMTESAEIPDTRVKRLLFRSWHRGTREMDLLLGRFAEAHLRTLSERELDLYEAVLDCADQELYDWITGKRPWPKPLNNDLMRRLTAFTLGNAGR